MRAEDQDTYCREIEAYLCRKNEGHLVRIVGPAFNMVGSWAAQGVPFKVACRGIDRYVERYYAKGPRRRPVRIEFCEADVLEVFDEWRRAVGIRTVGTVGLESGGGGQESGVGESTPRLAERPGHSLRAHLDRVVTRLTDLQASPGLPPVLDAFIAGLIEELAGGREASRALRGEARQEYLSRLERRDQELLQVARAAIPASLFAELREEAAEDLSGFRARMTDASYAVALDAATTKLLRDRLKLPTIAYGGSGL